MCTVLLPHARAVLDLTSGGMWTIALALGYSGSYLAARDLLQLITTAHEQTPPYGARATAASCRPRHELASWTGAGPAAEALDQSAALLPPCQHGSGAEHHDNLTACDNLAR